jgi:hypothetical protein
MGTDQPLRSLLTGALHIRGSELTESTMPPEIANDLRAHAKAAIYARLYATSPVLDAVVGSDEEATADPATTGQSAWLSAVVAHRRSSRPRPTCSRVPTDEQAGALSQVDQATRVEYCNNRLPVGVLELLEVQIHKVRRSRRA